MPAALGVLIHPPPDPHAFMPMRQSTPTAQSQDLTRPHTRRSRRPEGHLYRRGRIWWVKWTGIDGRPSYRSSRSRDRGVAEHMLREELQRKAEGLAPSADPRRCLVDDLLESHLARARTEGRRSLGRVALSIRHLLRFFRGVPAVQVTGAEVTRYADLRLQEHAKPATVNRDLATLRAAYRLGLRNGVISAVPHITLLPEHNVRTGFVDPADRPRITRHLPPDVADVVEFMAITGWRSQSEVFPLLWSQVDWAGGFVRLNPGDTKNKEGRMFPLIPELRAILERRLEITRRLERARRCVIPWVFHRHGRPIKGIRRSWATACRKAGFPGLVPHDLRRSAVRTLERAGIARSVAMKLTGHKTEAVYRRYAIVAERDLREAGSKLSAVLQQLAERPTETAVGPPRDTLTPRTKTRRVRQPPPDGDLHSSPVPSAQETRGPQTSEGPTRRPAPAS